MKIVLGAIAALCLASAAYAAGTSVTVSGLAPTMNGEQIKKQTVVKYADLNPADKAGAAALLARIQAASLAVCTDARTRSSLLVADKVAACRAKAVAQAVKDVDTPEIAAAAEAK
jgi:UrcA family protein